MEGVRCRSAPDVPLCGEMDKVSGDGHAELLNDGTFQITLANHNGGAAALKAKRQDNRLLGDELARS